MAKDTADDAMWAMLQRKREFLNKVGLSRDNLTDVTVENQEPVLPAGCTLDAIMNNDVPDEDEIPSSPAKRLKRDI